ncbi:MAG: hypothetical protein HGB36_00550 [Chlorobiaceae bacterium]|nr:hypothetical protein [Chlorobiaceae bacterium]
MKSVDAILFQRLSVNAEVMNERFFLKLLLGIFSGLIAAELLIVILAGFRLELILFCFIIAAALGGIVMVLRLLANERPEVDSVSMRRARAVREGALGERLQHYEIDEEFLSGNSERSDKGGKAGRGQSAKVPGVTVEEAIRTHADMCGGLSQLLVKMESIDDVSFSRLVTEAGFGTVSRNDLIRRIQLMAAVKDQETCSTIKRSLDEAIEAFSNDRESFDDYIRRSMTSSESHVQPEDEGFSVELDNTGLSNLNASIPKDFSHDPKSVISKLKKSGSSS